MFSKYWKSWIARSVLILALLGGMFKASPAQPAYAGTLVVTNANASGPGSLLQAIVDAVSGDTITFDPSLAGATIPLHALVIFDKTLTIDGSGLSPQVVLSGEDVSRIMYLYNIADVTLVNLALTKGFSDGGGAIEVTGSATLTLKNCAFYGNHSTLLGGAILFGGTGALTILNSTFYQNQTDGSGGAISASGYGPQVIANSTFFDNIAGGDGGAISRFPGTIIDSTFSRNIAGGSGGAIAGPGFGFKIQNTTINQNQATYGGGAIALQGGSRGTIVNSTITQNQANDSGGAIFATGQINVEVFNSTFAGNNAPAGSEVSGIGNVYIDLFNTILACIPGSTSCIEEMGMVSVFGPNSMIGTGTLASFGLAELADNGGPTQTMALLPGSPLIDAGDNSVCANALVNNLDQRGATRPQGGVCDIGAYEYESQPVNRHFVKWDASGTNDGSSWANAFRDLQSALAAASSGEEIWVAAGTYKPTAGTDRSVSFALKNGVKLYGGFAGTETFLSRRAIDRNVTVLSGDIGIAGDTSDNSYHVVTSTNVDGSSVLDGFTVTAGHANGPLVAQWSGGGMYNDHASTTMKNLIFDANWAQASGGGVMNYYSNPSLILVNFTANSATDFGGGMFNSNSSPSLTEVVFSANVATDFGSGMGNFNSSPIMTRVSFSNNTADVSGGGLYNNTSSPTLIDVDFNSNSAPHGGGMYIVNTGNPVLTDVTFSVNSATFGGGLYNSGTGNPSLTNVTFSTNTANAGGAIYNYQGRATLREVTFIRNSASGDGGAMYNQQSSALSLTDVMFIENTANQGRGGAIFSYADNTSFFDVTFNTNAARDGGGMYNTTGSNPTLTNVTFSGNRAVYSGGGMVNASNSNPSLINVTFSGNSTRGTGIGISNDSSNPTLINVILWNNTLPDGGEIRNVSSAPQISYSIVRGSGGSAAWNPAFGVDDGNNLDANPLLGTLANNGGYTWTMALEAGSPAIDVGENASCPDTDQRGLARPRGVSCDIGAYEFWESMISGNTTVGGVSLNYSGGSTTSDNNGNYSFTIPYNWSGSVIPSKPGYRFTPASRNYTNVQSDQPNQNFTAERMFTISGNVGVSGGTLSYEDNGTLKTVTALSNGNYSLQVPEHWTGTVTPSRSNVTFTPASRSYENLQSDQVTQNYTATITVINQNNSGPGSLRQAIADGLSGATINFAPALAGQTILLTSELNISRHLTVDGSGLNPRLAISGGGTVRILTLGKQVSGINVTLRSLILKDGHTDVDYGGAIVAWHQSILNINDVTFIGNTAPQAGAIQAFGFSKVTIAQSEFISNSAEMSGGAIYFQTPIHLTATKTKFRDNSASDGGAVYLDASGGAVFEENVFENNRSSFSGGAIAASNVPGVGLSLKGNLFSGNTAGTGGGAISITRLSSTSVIVENNTFFDNRAANLGGAISSGTSVEIRNNTFSNNQATNGGASLNLERSNVVNKLYNNIFANSNGGVECLPSSVLVSGSLIGNHNLVEDGSGACSALPGTIVADPMLGPLADNGGPTQTMALLPGSPAIDAGDDLSCTTVDQRGVTRPQRSHCDIGAYEYQDPDTDAPVVLSITRANPSPTSASSVDFTVTFSEAVTGVDTGDFVPQVTGNIKGTTIGSVTGSGSVYTVTVNTGFGKGTLGLEVSSTATITDFALHSLDNLPFVSGEKYTISRKHGGHTTGVFRPSNGLLYLKNTNDTGFADMALNYGLPGDYPVVGDWDGDGDATIGIYRNGKFYLRNDNSVGFADLAFAFGLPGDQPIAGDWDGDGVDTIGVYRSSVGLFLLRNSHTAGDAEMSFYLGNVGDVGIAGDWNGDGLDTTGVFRPSNGVIFLKNINDTGFADIALNYGLPGDKPVMGDWNNDGIDTIGIYRNGTFYLRNSNTNGFADMLFALGIPGDMPIAGDWDGQP